MSSLTKKEKIKILDKTLALLGGREGAKNWCKNALARDASGDQCEEKSKYAKRWCIAGTLCKFGGFELWLEIDRKAGRGKALSFINDEDGRGAALKVLRAYKKELEAK